MASVTGDICTVEGANNSTNPWVGQTKNQRDIVTQSVISIVFGFGAFIAFCYLRPRWTTLYAARRQQKNAASRLPELPDTFLGWIPTLYRITDEEVLASAGLDAYVFLSFFKMAIKYLATTFFLSLVVILPVHIHYTGDWGFGDVNLKPSNNTEMEAYYNMAFSLPQVYDVDGLPKMQGPTRFLWMYIIFVYLFTVLAMYLMVMQTKRIIHVRQEYLGTQSTVTDRTIRLSGIPEELRSEEKIKETIEELEIGKVDSVMLCRDWQELDDLMMQRMNVLRKLEEVWTVHLGLKRSERSAIDSRRLAQSDYSQEETSGLLGSSNHDQDHITSYAQDRPMTRIWYGFMSLQSRKIDAIDYYEEKLRKLDEQIKKARKKVYKPMPLAFVTLDSTAACQMAIQAVMDPEPRVLQANLAPAPSDVVWSNTYLSRSNRMIRAWTITSIIILLTILWSFLLVPLAGLLNLQSICKVSPSLANSLNDHPLSRTLVQTGLPTLLISLLSIIVPYLYYWLSNLQGMTSQGDVELSLISKNFFFTFFNLFLIFTIFGTVSKASDYFGEVGKNLRDTTQLSHVLATSLKNLAPFYVNLIVLQGLGLFPFRLLEFGSVAMYPVNLMGAKTPRDYAELVQPPVFSYGFYLPQTILVFIICTVYSVLPTSWLVLFFGLVYFIIGNFIYKYQLLYAMDHRQHSTGKAWMIICNCVVLGLIVFQLATAGLLVLQSAPKRSTLIIPLLGGTVWFTYFFQRTYEPLMNFIALRSLKAGQGTSVPPLGQSRYDSETASGREVDESPETGLRFINPSLIIPLEEVWLAKKTANGSSYDHSEQASLRTSAPILLSRATADLETEPTSSPTFPGSSIFENDSTQFISLDPPTRPDYDSIFSASWTIRFYNTLGVVPSDPLMQRIDPIFIREFIIASPVVHKAMGPETTRRFSYEAVNNLRPRPPTYSVALPPQIHVASPHSTPSVEASSGSSGPHSPLDNSESPTRGRTSDIIGAHHGLISRGTARRRAGPSSIEFDSTLMQNRLTSRGFSTEPSEIDSNILEPRPFLLVATNLVEVLDRQSTFGSMIDLTKFGGHRDTFALLGLPQPKQRRCSSALLLLFQALVDYLDFESYRAIRLTCRCWSAAISCARPPRLPPVYYLPHETIQQIYMSLSPIDFNAARRTCKAWMLASLDHGLLSTMLKRGGWWAAAQADIAYNQAIANINVEEDWLLSKRLATECAIRPDWTGNGLDRVSTVDCFSLALSPLREPFILTSENEFSEFITGHGANENDPYAAAVQFTTSVCGRFLLVVESCYIYVYSIRANSLAPSPYGGYLEAVTSIVCPLRVLAVSMNTSYHRYAVGALLEGRIGLVCDLRETNHLRNSTQATSQTVENLSGNSGYRAHVSSSRSSGDRAVTEQAEAIEPDINGRHPGRSWSNGGTDFDSLHARRGFLRDPVAPEHTFVLLDSNAYHNRSIPIESGTRSIYRNLCSEDDPPLSVAICPQRQCVAFGCSAGIELHWVDALTCQDFNRWFPLTAPSHFLYFLPPRYGVDSAKKLRLISSAGHPVQASASMHHFPGVHALASTPLLDDLQGTGYWYGAETRENCDHYRAVPLSDGTHVLFTDPVTGLLCLGCDAPASSAIKLTRKFVCQGPSGEVPMVYAAATELRWGVRIVCAYANKVWLFCVPGDFFAAGGKEVWQGMYGRHDMLGGIVIHGRQIGTSEGLMDVAVDAQGGDVTVWGCGRGGVVRCWQLNMGSGRCMRQRVVERSGRVRDMVDEDGDWIMRDAPALEMGGLGFDGLAEGVDGRDGEGVLEFEIGDEVDSGYGSDDERMIRM